MIQKIYRKKYNANDRLILICDDGIRETSSLNGEYQRKSYSVQKKTPLCKPFTIYTTDGFIVYMLGPKLANQNDATIKKEIIGNPEAVAYPRWGPISLYTVNILKFSSSC